MRDYLQQFLACDLASAALLRPAKPQPWRGYRAKGRRNRKGIAWWNMHHGPHYRHYRRQYLMRDGGLRFRYFHVTKGWREFAMARA